MNKGIETSKTAETSGTAVAELVTAETASVAPAETVTNASITAETPDSSNVVEQKQRIQAYVSNGMNPNKLISLNSLYLVSYEGPR